MLASSVVYRVDGEIGRFCVTYYDVQTTTGDIVFEGRALFPHRQGKQWYLTEGFKEQALLLGSSQQSYRKFQHRFNRWRRQEQGGSPVTTLRDASEREGLAILADLTETSQQVLAEQAFTEQAQPQAHSTWSECLSSLQPATQPKAKVQAAVQVVQTQMQTHELSQTAQEELSRRHTQEVFEHRETSVYLSVDDVGVKKQRAVRHRSSEPAPAASEGPKHPKVQNSVAYVEVQAQHCTLTGRSVAEVLLFCLALLLQTGQILKRLYFFTDGQTSLKETILTRFAWHPQVTLLLDWYHLVKKCKEHLSTALKGRELRNQHARTLLRLLWFGAWQEAVESLKAIPAEQIKNPQGMDKLLTYLNRNRAFIGCYALRRQLGLRNSSNRAENRNFLVTAARQKKNAMSWSPEGSYALTALNAVVCNGTVQTWIEKRHIPLEFTQPA